MALPQALTVRTMGMPRYVWIGALSGGVLVGLYLRSRRRNVEDEPAAVSDDTGATSALYGADTNYPFAPPTGYGGYIGGDGSTYDQSLQGSFDFAAALLEVYQRGIDLGLSVQPSPPPPELAPSAPPPALPGNPGGGAPAPPPRSSQVPPPAAPTKPNGYTAGSNVGSGNVQKNFPGASGWAELNTPDNRFREFHVAWPGGRLERWRGWGTRDHVPRSKRGKWEHIWTGTWRR